MIWNSYLIREYSDRKGTDQISHKQYMLKLAEILIGVKNEISEKEESSELPRAQNNSLGHIPTFGEDSAPCKGCWKKGRGRTTMRCKVCFVPLCKKCYDDVRLHVLE
jgi:hypothetical protein